MKSLEALIHDLPPELEQEVVDFIEFLLERRSRKLDRTPTFAWAGALKDLKGRYDSVQLQHAVSLWRSFDTDFDRTSARRRTPSEITTEQPPDPEQRSGESK